jgi:hypothetical protein
VVRNAAILKNAVLGIIFLLSLISFSTALRTPSAGGDFDIYCASLRLAGAGADPHDVDALTHAGAPKGLPMTTPVVALLPMRPVCSTRQYAPIWIIAAAATIALVGVLDPHPHWLLLAAAVLGGFDAVRWMLLTGNIAIFEMLFAGGAIASLLKKRGRVPFFSRFIKKAPDPFFCLGLGAATFLKILPVAFSIMPAALARNRRALAAAAGVAITFVLMHAAGFLFMPQASAFYWTHLLHGFGGFFGAEAIYGGNAHPSALSLFSDISASLTGRSWPALLVYVAFAGIVAADLFVFLLKNRPEHAKALGLCGLGLLLMMPRLKPYAFGLGVVPLYLAAKPLRAGRQIVLMVVGCVLPLAAAEATSTDVFPALRWVLGYGQLFALASVYALVRFGSYSESENRIRRPY